MSCVICDAVFQTFRRNILPPSLASRRTGDDTEGGPRQIRSVVVITDVLLLVLELSGLLNKRFRSARECAVRANRLREGRKEGTGEEGWMKELN
jgi:hypothetical protein